MTTNAQWIDTLARTAHEANRAYCLSIGDTSQPSWDDAPDWQKDSARNGVKGVLTGATPGLSHASWLQQKLADGWKYGPVKDPAKKEHPCMVPFEELPPEQQRKDHIFVGVVRAMVEATTLEMKGEIGHGG